MKKIISGFGILIIVYMICLFININYNVGIMLGLLVGSILAVFPWLGNTLPLTIIKALMILCICYFIIMSTFIFAKSISNKPTFDEDALIVLGCGLHGKDLSKNLKDRLDTSLEYIAKNPNVTIVVSGGQGPQEDISEAQAMYDYLVNNNVKSSNIIMEDKSTSTNENFIFSKSLLDNIFENDYTITYITNDFHIYRAGKLAKKNGLNATGYSAPTEIFSIMPNYLRECLAVIQLWVFNR